MNSWPSRESSLPRAWPAKDRLDLDKVLKTLEIGCEKRNARRLHWIIGPPALDETPARSERVQKSCARGIVGASKRADASECRLARDNPSVQQ